MVALATCHEKGRDIVLWWKYQAYGKGSQAACVGAEGGDDRAEQHFWPSQAGFPPEFLSSFVPVS